MNAVRFIDTHAHLDEFHKEGTVPEVLARARDAAVVRVVAIGGTPEANTRAMELATQYPNALRATIGLDRDEINRPIDLSTLRREALHPLVVAVGESGLDYHYGPDTRKEQRTLFAEMLDVAAMARRPVVVHSRDADEDTISMLRDFIARPGVDADRPGVLHCFTGSAPFARRLLDLGFLLSFSGILTFKNAADLRAVARMAPLDRILVETDAPYLAPVPNRGKRNEPAWVVHVATALARERGISLQSLAEHVWNNAARLFAWDKEEYL